MNKVIELLKSKLTLGEKVFAKNYPDEYNQIIEYTNPFSIIDWCEKKYFFINQLKEIPKCKICNNNTRYYKPFNRYADTCCRECDKKLKSQSHSKIWNNYTEEEKQNRLEHAAIIREEKTGYKSSFADPKVKEKSKKTILNKYGVDNISKSNIFKDKFKDKDWLSNILNKKHETYKKNNSFNKSEQEEHIYNLLFSKFPNTIRQYKDERYPFNCDFYIPELDLFIEYNGTWTHGSFPFNNDDKCLKILNEWKSKSIDSQFYKNAIYNWTIRDPRKRQIAKENKLNWMEFFNMEDFNAWFELL